MPVGTNKTKRRRYIRYAIELEAALIFKDSLPVPCVIQDFCSGGFFLGFKQSIAEISFPDDKKIEIHFSIGPEYGVQNFQIGALIMHASPNGLGVAVENMPTIAFNALKKAANNEAITASYAQGGASDKQNQENLKKIIKKMLDVEIPLLLGKFFECFGDDLIKAKENSTDFLSRSAIEDIITIIKLNRESIFSEYCSAILLEVDHIFEFNHEKEAEISIDRLTLALVEKDDFEDWLNLSSNIRKLKNLYKSRINQIEEKLSHVFGSPIQAIKNPIGPGILCDNFRGILLQLDLSIDIKQTLYMIFEKILTNGLSDLYDHFDKILLDYGVPNQLVPRIIKQPDKAVNETRSRVHRKSDNSQYVQASQMPPLASNEALINLMHLAEQKYRQPVAQVAKKLLDIFKETDAVSATEAHDGLTEKNAVPVAQAYPVFSADEVAAAISKIQKNDYVPSGLNQNPVALQKYLQDTLNNAGNSQKVLSTGDANQLEVYGRLFETLFNDSLVSSEIKSYMESIQLPLLSMSLQGNDFLDSNSHPARNVINQLATLESAVKGNKIIKKTNIKNTLDKLVSRITKEAGTNPNIFAEVEQELNEVTSQVSKSIDLNIKRMVETYQGQQQLEMARRTVQQEVDKRCAGKSIPKVIPTLLSSGWQHLLVISELNQEKENTEKPSYYQVIDDLMLWLSSHESILDEQSGSIKKTLELIDAQLSSVGTNAFTHDSLVEELTDMLIGSGSPRVRRAVEMITIEPLSRKEEAPVEVGEDKWILQVEQLQVGEWLTILRDPDGYEPMKLVWIGELPPIFVFANRDGLNKLEFTKAELAELLKNGGANLIENLDEPLMDRTTNTMLQKMHEKLVYNAIHDPVTELFTRDEFVKQLKHELAIIGNSAHMLCQIEVQDLRMITNICGVAGGNQLLKKLTRLLADPLKNGEIVARLGDKTFGILFKNCSPDRGYETAKKLADIIGESHFEWEDKSYSIAVSMGLTPFAVNGYDVHQLLQQADSASISAMDSGQNHIQLFKEDDERLKRQNKVHEWAGQIDKVLSENRLFIRCQKIAPAEPNRYDHTHYEILMGVRDNVGNFVPPDHFIPAAERCNRMPEIDQWIIRHVFGWIGQNRNYFDQMDGFSINLSGQSINKASFLDFLKDLLATSSVPPQKITFEITETVAADSLAYVDKFIKQIKQFGCKFSLDDFGSGYSSYSYLKNLDVDYLKIDGAFVKDIANNKADVAIVKSMNEIAHSLGMLTIAEYVENDEIRDILKEIGVDFVQGYGIQKPILLTELLEEPRVFQDFDLTADHNFSEEKNVVEDITIPEVDGLAEDNEFWGF